MYVTKDKDGKPVWVLPPNRTVTGISSRNGRSTFYRHNGETTSARYFEEGEAKWIGLSMLFIAILGFAMANLLISNGGADARTGTCGFLILIAFATTLAGVKSERFIVTELLLVGGLLQILFGEAKLYESEGIIGIGCIAISLARYGYLWMGRSLWEPFVFTVLFTAIAIAFRADAFPNAMYPFAFGIVAITSFTTFMMMLCEGWTYTQARENYIMNND